jgi:hypothetical protein
MYVWSFGVSYKNPVFIYSAMLPMALLGPTELAVRLTAALYGSGTVIALFFLGRALMGSAAGLIAALLLAVCPWHLHFSRIGFELIALPFFFTLATTSLVRWTQGRRTLPQAMVCTASACTPTRRRSCSCPLSVRLRRSTAALAAAPARTPLPPACSSTAAPVVIFDLTHRKEAGATGPTRRLARDEPPRRCCTFAQNYPPLLARVLFRTATTIIAASAARPTLPLLRPAAGDRGGIALARDRAMRLPLLWLGLYPWRRR